MNIRAEGIGFICSIPAGIEYKKRKKEVLIMEVRIVLTESKNISGIVRDSGKVEIVKSKKKAEETPN